MFKTESIFAQITSMRERTISLQKALQGHPAYDAEIKRDVGMMLAALASMEARLQGADIPALNSIDDQQLEEIATAVSNKLGKNIFLAADEPARLSLVKPSKPS